MDDYFSVITPLLCGSEHRTMSVNGCTFTVFALPYTQLSPPQAGRAFIDSYYTASNRAYFLKKKLAALLETAGFTVVDFTYPYKHFAAAAGLGVPLRSTLIANEIFGTRMALEIVGVRGVFAQELDEKALADHPASAPACTNCKRCVAACPQGCFDGNSFTPEKCVRYMQERAEFPDESSAAAMGQNLWGCDICQRVCPFNAAQATREPDENELEMFRLDRLFTAFCAGKKGCEPFRDVLGANYLRPAKLLALTLNAMANSTDPAQFRACAEKCLNHADARVRRAAQRLHDLCV